MRSLISPPKSCTVLTASVKYSLLSTRTLSAWHKERSCSWLSLVGLSQTSSTKKSHKNMANSLSSSSSRFAFNGSSFRHSLFAEYWNPSGSSSISSQTVCIVSRQRSTTHLTSGERKEDPSRLLSGRTSSSLVWLIRLRIDVASCPVLEARDMPTPEILKSTPVPLELIAD